MLIIQKKKNPTAYTAFFVVTATDVDDIMFPSENDRKKRSIHDSSFS